MLKYKFYFYVSEKEIFRKKELKGGKKEEMKKTLVFLVMTLSLLGVMGMVMGDTDNQDVDATFLSNVDVSVTDLTFNGVVPGTPKLASFIITLNEANNVNVDVSIDLDEDNTDSLLENGAIVMDLTDIGGGNSVAIGLSDPVLGSIADNDSGSTTPVNIDATLSISSGTSPGSASGVIIYTFTEDMG